MARIIGSFRFFTIAGVLLVLAALLLRSGRLLWQPLWWDEGYTVYFATEPITTMMRLTAQDIHPPLYYGLLHGWLLIWGSASPLVLRAFSILAGVLAIPAIGWLAHLLFPARPSISLLSVVLLAISPIHLFYSQEVRMYGLALLLGILSTGYFWQMVAGEGGHRGSLIRYVLATAALLYVEYYGVLLPLAHFLWALGAVAGNAERRRGGLLGRLIVADLIVALLYVPWLLYTFPYLTGYIAQKVVADADRPLGVLSFLWRYLLAFTGGHLAGDSPWLHWLRIGGTGGALLVLLAAFGDALARGRARRMLTSPLSLLPVLLLVGFIAGFLLNLSLPFFPEGGERVLLFVLPYFLILLATGLHWLWRQRPWGMAGAGIGAMALGAAAVAGSWTFYTVPRYEAEDYRPLIRQTVAQGSDGDTVFAVFPWQLGYWRAYAPVWGRGERRGPWPLLSASPAWGKAVAAQLDGALAQGKLWFPSHRTLGAILENEIDAYLAGRALQFDDRWYTTTTRMSGWVAPPAAEMQPLGSEIDFGPVRLRSESAVSTQPVASANEVLPLSLGWILDEPGSLPLKITLRLLDMEGRVWAGRELQWDRGDSRFEGPAMSMGLLIPAGLPPQTYVVAAGVGPAEIGSMFIVTTPEGPADVLPLATVQVVAPAQRQSPARLAIQQRLANPVLRNGIAFLGFSGYDPDVPTLAGTEVNLSLFVQNQEAALPPLEFYASLLDENRNGVAGWEGFPFSEYPATMWTRDALVRLPINLYIPANLEPGAYTLVAGVISPTSGQKSTPVKLGELPVSRRQVRIDAPPPQFPLTPPVQLGTHALLRGYDLTEAGSTLQLTLYWEVLQTLLPPHQVFVHLTTADGEILAQDDGVPGEQAVAAPSGTWLPGEIIVDPHILVLPPALPADAVIRTGLYIQKTGVRLPVVVGGQIAGDAVTFPVNAR